jgi:ATP-binding cassette subfamily B protein
VLDDVNLELAPGTVVAIVGENGAGKSTLVKLLCRMYPPDEGRILVDGADLARMPAEAWRSRVAGAFQDFFRFEFRARPGTSRPGKPFLDAGIASPRNHHHGRDAAGAKWPRGWRFLLPGT